MKTKHILILILSIVILIVAFNFKNIKTSIFKNKEKNIDEKIEYFVVFKGKKAGVVDKKGNIVIPIEYYNIAIPDYSKDIFFCYKDNIDFKILNKDRNEVLKDIHNIEPINTSGLDTKANMKLLKYKENDKYGLINLDGKRLTKPIYDSVESFDGDNEKYKIVLNGKVGLLDERGKMFIRPQYSEIKTANKYQAFFGRKDAGYILTSINETGEKYGFANDKGRVLIKPKYEYLIRAVNVKSDDCYLIVQEKGRKGAFKNSRRIVESKYQELIFSEQSIITKEYNKYGMKSLDGRDIISPRFEKYRIFGKYTTFTEQGKDYTYDAIGNEVANSEYMVITDVPDKNYIIVADKDNKMRIIYDGRLTKESYDDIYYAFDDYFIVVKNEKYGVIDVLKGSIIPIEYTKIDVMRGTNILQATKGNENYLYDKQCVEIKIPKDFTYKRYAQGIIRINGKNDLLYIDNNGKRLNPEEVFKDNKYYARKNDKNLWGFVDKNGNTVVDYKYELTSDFNKQGFAAIKKGGLYGVIDENLNIVVEPKYSFEHSDILPSFVGKYLVEENLYGVVLDID